MIEKNTMRFELRSKIKEILLYEWDPIGIKDSPDAQDEYDTYIDTLYSYVITKSDFKVILNYLRYIQEKVMGLDVDEEKLRKIAQKLWLLE